jgi:hypothetical protein
VLHSSTFFTGRSPKLRAICSRPLSLPSCCSEVHGREQGTCFIGMQCATSRKHAPGLTHCCCLLPQGLVALSPPTLRSSAMRTYLSYKPSRLLYACPLSWVDGKVVLGDQQSSECTCSKAWTCLQGAAGMHAKVRNMVPVSIHIRGIQEHAATYCGCTAWCWVRLDPRAS